MVHCPFRICEAFIFVDRKLTYVSYFRISEFSYIELSFIGDFLYKSVEYTQDDIWKSRNRVQRLTEEKIIEEQGGFRKGRGCVDQIFAMKRLLEEHLRKDKKLYAAFMDLEKAYNRVDREALWSVMKIYGVGGQPLKEIQAFYRSMKAVYSLFPFANIFSTTILKENI